MAADFIAKTFEFPDAVMYGVADATNTVLGPLCALFKQGLTAVAPQAVKAVTDFAKDHAHPEYTSKLPLMDPLDVLFGAIFYVVFIVFGLRPIARAIGELKLKGFSKLAN